MRKVLSVLGGLLVIGGAVVKIGMKATDSGDGAKQLPPRGHHWDDAKGQLASTYAAALEKELSPLGVVGDQLRKASVCMAEKMVGFLNTTECRYHYNTADMSKEQHLANQEQCLKKVGSQAKEEAATFECGKKHFTNDWAVRKDLIAKEFETAFVKKGTEATKAITLSACIASAVVASLQESDCKLIDVEATEPAKLFRTLDGCLERPELKSKFDAIIARCKGE